MLAVLAFAPVVIAEATIGDISVAIIAAIPAALIAIATLWTAIRAARSAAKTEESLHVPNGGGNVKDQLNRIERVLDHLAEADIQGARERQLISHRVERIEDFIYQKGSV